VCEKLIIFMASKEYNTCNKPIESKEDMDHVDPSF